MFKGMLKAFQPLVYVFEPEFCDQAVEYLHREISRLEKEKLKADAIISEIEKGDMTNPFRIICANDLDSFTNKMDTKIKIAQESLCELNIRKQIYELSKNILKEEPSDYIEAAARKNSPTFSDSSGSSGYHSAGSSPEVRKFPEGTVALLGGEVSYFTLEENKIPESLYRS
ncbi:unnamed protein product [Hermetia illucens]|uniref:Uncharacterized protein n=1 Tax=Hermetia illucens TaxID=343691 RepID=A0A7R8YKZ5_HERIL|nr:unnamed protein product [Hermetia illucens]